MAMVRGRDEGREVAGSHAYMMSEVNDVAMSGMNGDADGFDDDYEDDEFGDDELDDAAMRDAEVEAAMDVDRR